MNLQYEVTIGIPVYRSVDYIRQTMESAICQTFPDIEFLVVDDCGEDGSIAVVEQLQQDHPRGKDIRIVSHGRNLGVGLARNRILDEARGKYLFFLDSDDMIAPNTIEKLVSVASKYDTDVVYGSWERVDTVNHTPSQKSIYPYQELLTSNSLTMYAFKNYSSFRISVCNCLFKLSFLRTEQLKFIDSLFWEDLTFTYEMVTRVKRAILLPDITYYYLCRSGSLSHYQDRELLQKEEILNNAQTINYLKEKSRGLVEKPYAPFLCYNLEMNSFYIICHILNNRCRIFPEISKIEMHSIIRHPLDLKDILRFRNKRFQNLFFWTVGQMPSYMCVLIIKLLYKIRFFL